MLHQSVIDNLRGVNTTTNAPKRGEAIFEGTDFPRTWEGFVGQVDAIEQLQDAIASAAIRKARHDHMLFASGVAGIGKTTLATLVAYLSSVGFLQTTGPLDVEDARRLMKSMSDGDVLFIDEGHKLVDGNRNRADWILPFMTEGVLLGPYGAEKMPDISIFLATTDAGKLPTTLRSRFMEQITFVDYSVDEAALIAYNLAGRMGFVLPAQYCEPVAVAADHNPRVMRRILTAFRNLSLLRPGEIDMDKVYARSGVTADGLSTMACDILSLLYSKPKHTASIASIGKGLGEPGPLDDHEQILWKRGLIEISGQGRKLTDLGRQRVKVTAAGLTRAS